MHSYDNAIYSELPQLTEAAVLFDIWKHSEQCIATCLKVRLNGRTSLMYILKSVASLIAKKEGLNPF